MGIRQQMAYDSKGDAPKSGTFRLLKKFYKSGKLHAKEIIDSAQMATSDSASSSKDLARCGKLAKGGEGSRNAARDVDRLMHKGSTQTSDICDFLCLLGRFAGHENN